MVDTMLDGQVFMKGGENMARQVADRLMTFPEIELAITAQQALRAAGAEGQGELLASGFMPQRCGEVLYTLKPGYFEAEGSFVGKGTTHGSGWNYDTHVPVILFGQGIAHGEVVRKTAVADIVPTVCMIVGCALPDAAVGEPVQEVLVR